MSEYNNGNNPLHSSDTTNPEARYTQPQPPQVWQSWHEANGSQPAPTPVSPAAAPQTAHTPASGFGGGSHSGGNGKPPKGKKPHSGNRMIALVAAMCVCSVLLGGTAGGVISYSVMKNNTTAAQTQGQPTASPSDNGGSSSAGFNLEDATKPTAARENQEPMSVAQINEAVGPSVVAINTRITATNNFGQTQQGTGGGSGVIISSDGYILTNNHVIESASSIEVQLSNGDTYEAKVVGNDAKTDLAVLKIEASGLTAATLGNSDEVVIGDMAVAIGNPTGQLPGSVSFGIISGLNREITFSDGRTLTLLQTDAAINPGNSGGALVNAYGEVIGINTAKTTDVDVENLGFAIPINDIKPVIEELINNGYVTGRPLIGIGTRTVTEEIARAYNLPIGAYVATVEPYSGAEKAGIQVGDVIVAADGKTITTSDDLTEIRDQHKAGDTISMTIHRNGQEKTVEVTLTEDKPATTTGAPSNG